MERQVIFRDRQEEQAADLNDIQTFADESFAHYMMDAITGERMIVGLQVTQHSATELDIAAGRLWDGPSGKVFQTDAAETLSIYSYLPVQDQKYLAIAVIGQEVESDNQPRDFLIDLQSGQTEPRVVPMELIRQVAIQITPGLESTAPQKPEAPTGYTLIAVVLLSTSGIVSIELASNKRLMRLFEVNQTVLANVAWIALASPKLASLASDIAALATQLKTLIGGSPLLLKLAADVALLKDKVQLPNIYSDYDADNFLNKSKSDLTNNEFYAYVSEGVRFPWDGEIEQQISLFNPYDTGVKNFTGFVLPAHDKVARLSLTGYAGDLSLSQYQYQTLQSRKMTRTIVRTRYSNTYVQCSNGAEWGEESGASVVEQVFEGEVPAGVTIGSTSGTRSLGVIHDEPGHVWTRYQGYWVDAWTEDYWVVDSVTETINGCENAQTILNSQNGWLLSIGLNFSKKATDGPVAMLLCKTSNGQPDLQQTLGSVTVQPADIKIDEETEFEFPQPIFMSPGIRYAIVLITGGAHSIKLVEGTAYSQGTLFYSTDGEYFQGDFTKDFMMTLYYAQFKNTRTVVDLAPISLSGGMAAFDILAQQITPDSTNLAWEYQPSGTGEWVTIAAGTADRLLGLPAMCRLRAVFNGSQDIMPGLGLSGSKFRALRAGNSWRHISTERQLGAASQDIRVVLLLEGWNPAKHNVTCKLLSGADTILPATTVDETVDAGSIRRTFNFSPPAPGITAYKMMIEGTTTTPLECCHVARRMDVAL